MRWHAFRRAALLGIVLVVAVTGSVAASSSGAVVTGVRGCAGQFPPICWNGDFVASWSVVEANQDGTNVWKVTNLSMSDVAELGRDCSPEICDSWYAGAHIWFLNSAGAQVGAELSPAQVGTCYASVYDYRSEHWGFCRAGFYMAPISARTVKVNWDIYMAATNGNFFTVFNVTKIVSLT